MTSTVDLERHTKADEGRNDLPTPEPDSPFRPRKPYRFSTLCATVENPSASHQDQHGSSSVPIYQSATFKGIGGEYDYSRSGNPTRSHLGELETTLTDSRKDVIMLHSNGVHILEQLVFRMVSDATY
jgi:cystathionine beta-lyase/cystathionine gamma-synthase